LHASHDSPHSDSATSFLGSDDNMLPDQINALWATLSPESNRLERFAA